MSRLDAHVREWTKDLNIDQANLEAMLQERHLRAVEICITETNRIIAELRQGASLAGSLTGYEAVAAERGPRGFNTPAGRLIVNAFEVVVEARPAHRRLKINIFKILDTGRKFLPKLPPSPNEAGKKGRKQRRKVYLLWSWEGERTLKVPTSSVKNEATGRFAYTTGKKYHAVTPVRQEPRNHRTRFSTADSKGIFSKGPLNAVPGRNLYQRILANTQKKLRKEGLPTDIVRLS